ncbi:hypothetical protein HD806DRAFT_98649 [Xylariaceae sp. AK1471]|nr:hypothetical protein HD806DRAFT_98649 [Xylariaceae sp. AK1471]
MEKLNFTLVPPFSQTRALRSSTRKRLPHSFRQGSELVHSGHDIHSFLKNDLETPKLNKVHQYLWLAGLPRPARFIHRQRVLDRVVVLTESPEEHLVWHDSSFRIKPVPEYLLDHDFWEKYLCSDEKLYKSAYGLLLSYTWLICHKSDHRIAVDTGVLPDDIDYDAWTAFATDLSTNNGFRTARLANERYEYGELRLSRLNHLYRLGAAGFSLRNMVFGFAPGSTRYPVFFQRYFGWILAAFVYFTVLLSAVQVALATDRFGRNAAFQDFSGVIALLSLAFVLVAVVVMLLVWTFMFWFHLTSTIRYIKKMKLQQMVAIGPGSM